MRKNQLIQKMLHKSGLYFRKYSPMALSCVASVGVIVTAVVAVKATPKALSLVMEDSRKNHDGDPYAYTKKEAIASAWKCYIPAAAFGVSTIACIMSANALNRRQQAALTSAYALLLPILKQTRLKSRMQLLRLFSLLWTTVNSMGTHLNMRLHTIACVW